MKLSSLLFLSLIFFSLGSFGEGLQIYSQKGKYLGNLNNNRYDPNSVANPYGQYGSQYSPDSINNPYGRYGSPYSPDSANNPYGRGVQIRQNDGWGNDDY